MGIDLINEKKKGFGVSWVGWRGLLDMAVDHGWKPKGTLLFDRYRLYRELGYCRNDGHLVTPDDSGAIADALMKALKDVDVTDPRDAAFIKRFIDYCRQGAFRIW